MAKILIAEDELIYREYLAAALDAEGHNVKSCIDGRDAIKVGSTFRPDILIADWMLKSHVHGLHVARVLRHINPKQQTILITGFPSADLMLEAELDDVFAFIRKPFDLGELKEKVHQASVQSPQKSFHSQVGFLEIDATDKVRYLNDRARELFALSADQQPENLSDLPVDTARFLQGAATRDWFDLDLKTREARKLHLHSLQFADKDGQMIILLDDEHRLYIKSKLIELMISSHTDQPVDHFWPFEGRILLVDHNPNLRRVAVDLFDSAGTLCHSCDNYAAALKVIERDTGIRYVLLDYETVDRLTFPGGLTKLVQLFQTKIPDITVIGHSERNRGKEFIAVGVPFFIRKPWTIEQLIDTITGH